MVTQHGEKRRRERKAIVCKLLVIALVALLVCLALRYIQPAHTCDRGAALQDTNVGCAK